MATTTRALAFVTRWFDAKIVSGVFDPLIADWQREWLDAPRARRPLVSLRGWSAFAVAVVISSPHILRTRTPPAVVGSVVVRIAAFCSVIGGALSIPMIQTLAKQSMEPLSWPALFVIAAPTAFAIAFPFAMIVAVDAIRGDTPAPAHVERAAALKLAGIAIAVALLTNGFIAPLANQQWRERSTPSGWNVPETRPSQMSTLTLIMHPDLHGTVVPGHYTRAGEMRRTLAQRFVGAVLPAVLVWLRWSTTTQRRRQRRWYSAAIATLAVTIAVFALWLAGAFLELSGHLPYTLGLWTPIAGLLTLGYASRWLGHQRTENEWRAS